MTQLVRSLISGVPKDSLYSGNFPEEHTPNHLTHATQFFRGKYYHACCVDFFEEHENACLATWVICCLLQDCLQKYEVIILSSNTMNSLKDNKGELLAKYHKQHPFSRNVAAVWTFFKKLLLII